MDYPGEHLVPGQLGHFCVTLSMVSSLVAAVAYFVSTRSSNIQDAHGWKRLGRWAFGVSGISVLTVFASLLYVVATHKFEYYYAYEHSSRSLSPKYLLSCIWEGQEGSFLLWSIWNIVLGCALMRTSKQWEAPVMGVMSTMQAMLATMVLGVYVFGFQIGKNPFLLTREFFRNAPIFNLPDYMSQASMQDGQGLNQLLQNYWMVIHPPILFLGFASTIVPFAYAIAGLLTKKFGGWTKQALPWTLFSACILGTGIMMGAAWAYESLTFGGYWAWDPVENASLVPWLVLIAGLHTQVVYNATGHSLRATYFFHILTFSLILYASYLTKSGDLQDTSVHSFANSGTNWQLRIFILLFFLPAIGLFIKRYKQIPFIAKEESSYSREFWMFIGSLVFFLTSIFIATATSLPVINKVFHTSFAIGNDAAFAYNKIIIFIAIVIGLLTAIAQYLRYKLTPAKYFTSKILLPSIIAVVLSTLISVFGGIHYDKYGIGFLAAIHGALFAAVYAVVANATYIRTALHGKLKAAGGSVAHIGFGLMLVGILISSSKKEVLSFNTTGIPLELGGNENPLENITLIKSLETDMGKYHTTYINSDSTDASGNMMYFKINFKQKNKQEEFTLYPNLIKNTKGQEGFSNNPDSRHYWNKDIFSYISYADNMDRRTDTAQYRSYALNVHDTVYYSNGFIVLNGVEHNPVNDKFRFTPSDTALMADVKVVSKEGYTYQARPVFYVEDNQGKYLVDTVYAQNLAIGFSKVLDNRKIELQVKESNKLVPFVSLKVYEFPFIGVLWVGTIIMIVGFAMSTVRRIRMNRALKSVA
ncbi:MAG: cytochrome c biogenesis protein CcsA [Williamsia sp.]|nr:cytochrome c biogenesis protein CcsA [Williamsia sp.]